MRRFKYIWPLLICWACSFPTVASAQEEGASEATIIVTSSRSDRSDSEYYDDDQSAIGLTRKADYFVKRLFVSSDSRDPQVRKSELLAMLRKTIEIAPQSGITLVAGDYSLKRVSLENVDDLPISSGRRPDTSRVTIYARIPVTRADQRADETDKKIESFVKKVPVTGRSFIETGSTNLAINNPDQYRLAVVKAIADEAKRYASLFGNDYGVEIRGLDSELFWQQASQTEVFLFIEHSFVIKPK
ncbi:MAG: hypothetical protein V7679_01755 [Parasphingorhabdus sp.]